MYLKTRVYNSSVDLIMCHSMRILNVRLVMMAHGAALRKHLLHSTQRWKNKVLCQRVKCKECQYMCIELHTTISTVPLPSLLSLSSLYHPSPLPSLSPLYVYACVLNYTWPSLSSLSTIPLLSIQHPQLELVCPVMLLWNLVLLWGCNLSSRQPLDNSNYMV